MKKRKLVVIGVGGIGTALYPAAYLFLQNRKDENWEVWLIDKDKFELKNSVRQFVPNGSEYPVGENKAKINAIEYKKLFPGITFKPIPDYVDEFNIYSYIQDGDIVLSGIDNHNSRKIIQDYCETLNNIALISGGNELVTGDVLLYHKLNGDELLKPMTILPEIGDPQDLHPSAGCDNLVESVPQIGVMNNMVAAQMIVMLHCILVDGKFPCQRIYINIKNGACRTVKEYECGFVLTSIQYCV